MRREKVPGDGASKGTVPMRFRSERRSVWSLRRKCNASFRPKRSTFETPVHGLERFSPMLRHKADWRTVLWAFVFFPLMGLLPYAQPRVLHWGNHLFPWLLPLGLYFGFCAGVFSHNHNHSPIFKGKKLNTFYSAWLSVFYLYPTWVWI